MTEHLYMKITFCSIATDQLEQAFNFALRSVEKLQVVRAATNQTVGKGSPCFNKGAWGKHTHTHIPSIIRTTEKYTYKPTFLGKTIIVLISAKSLNNDKKKQ